MEEKLKYQESEIQTALSLSVTAKIFKIVLALVICYAYFMSSSWLTEIIVFSVVITLIIPLGFFDTFIQKLVEYNTQVSENRQLLNATEANKYFEKAFNKISTLEKKKKRANT